MVRQNFYNVSFTSSLNIAQLHYCVNTKIPLRVLFFAGALGFEPRIKVLETFVIAISLCAHEHYYTKAARLCLDGILRCTQDDKSAFYALLSFCFLVVLM